VKQPLLRACWLAIFSLVCVAAFYCRPLPYHFAHYFPQVYASRPLATRVRMQSTELFHFSQTFEKPTTPICGFLLAPVDSPDAPPLARAEHRLLAATSPAAGRRFVGDGCSACGFGSAACAAPRSAVPLLRTAHPSLCVCGSLRGAALCTFLGPSASSPALRRGGVPLTLTLCPTTAVVGNHSAPFGVSSAVSHKHN